jgi:hypothetical protein
VDAGVAEASAVLVASVDAAALEALVDQNHAFVSRPRARGSPQQPMQDELFELCRGSEFYLTHRH